MAAVLQDEAAGDGKMGCRRRLKSILLIVCLPIAGCAALDPREDTMTDRCAAVMKAAYVGDLKITSQSSHADVGKEAGTMIADVRANGPKSEPLGLECVFRDSTLMSIRWTQEPAFLR
jgi:hypothetical protein